MQPAKEKPNVRWSDIVALWLMGAALCARFDSVDS